MRFIFQRSVVPTIGALSVVVSLVPFSPAVYAAPTGKVNDRQLAAIQGRVSADRDVFGGLIVDETSHVATIYVASGASSSRKQQALTNLATASASGTDLGTVDQGKWTVRYVTRDPSLASLDRVLAKVKGLSWSAGIADHWISYGVDVSNGTVSVGVDAVSAGLAADTRAAFGSLVTLKIMERPKLLSRLADAQPWWGGDRIYDSFWWGGNVQCTAGFPAYRNSDGHRGMLTAGHCFSSGENAKQGWCDSNGNCHYYGNMGNVASYSYCNYCLDGEWLDTQAAGSRVQFDVYTTHNSNGTDNSATVYGWGQSSVGLGVCLDGSFTTQNCGATVVSPLEQCVDVGGQVNCNLTEIHSSSRACQEGDSGGPVYRYWGSSAIGAYGLVDAGNTAGTDCFYTEARDAMNVLGVTVLAY